VLSKACYSLYDDASNTLKGSSSLYLISDTFQKPDMIFSMSLYHLPCLQGDFDRLTLSLCVLGALKEKSSLRFQNGKLVL